MQLLMQKQSLRKELNHDCEELNVKNKNEKKNVVHNTGSQKAYTVIPSSTTENTISVTTRKNVEKKRSTQKLQIPLTWTLKKCKM